MLYYFFDSFISVVMAFLKFLNINEISFYFFDSFISVVMAFLKFLNINEISFLEFLNKDLFVTIMIVLIGRKY